MNEDDAETVVGVEVRVLVTGDEGNKLRLTPGHVPSGIQLRRNLDRGVARLEEPADLREERRKVDDHGNTYYVVSCAPTLGGHRVADSDVSLTGECHGKPDGRSVEHSGKEVSEDIVGEAPAAGYVVAMVP